MHRRTRAWLSAAIVVVAALFWRPALADDYPSRTVRIIVPWPAGALTDAVARIVAEKLKSAWNQPVIVENRPGANGAIGTEFIKSSTADGYVLGIATAETHAINAAAGQGAYHPEQDFTPIALLAKSALVLVTHPSSGAESIEALAARAKARPDSIRYASWGVNSTSHLAWELFQRAVPFPAVHVPYRGAAQALTDLTAGHVETGFAGLSGAVPFIRDGKLRALAVTSDERFFLLPETPTLRELGAEVVVQPWYGLVGPKDLAPEVAGRISAAISEALRDEWVLSRLAAIPAQPLRGGPAEFRDWLKAERAKWGEAVATASRAR